MGYAIDPVAQIDSIELTYQWFDYVMRGAPKPTLIKDRINYQVMGANIWKHAPSIDAMSTKKLNALPQHCKRRRALPSQFEQARGSRLHSAVGGSGGSHLGVEPV